MSTPADYVAAVPAILCVAIWIGVVLHTRMHEAMLRSWPRAADLRLAGLLVVALLLAIFGLPS